MPKTYVSGTRFQFVCDCGKSYTANEQSVLDRYLRLHKKYCDVDLTDYKCGVTTDIRISPDTKAHQVGDFYFYEKPKNPL